MKILLSINHRMLCLFLLGIAAILLFSCAGKPDQPLTEEAEKDLLKSRVLARWNAMIAEDYDKAYEFTTPSYRRTYSKSHFFGQYGGQISRDGVTVRDIVFEDPEHKTAKVVINLDFTAEGATPGTLFHNTSYLEDTWVKEEDQWWRVEVR
ncbi:MAG: hypothetical protein ACU843_04650 [Gammaproteobacteria bacterium]